MNGLISVNLLKNELKQAKETNDFPHPQNLLEDASYGVKYLFEKAYLDFMVGRTCSTSDLDYDEFELEDIYELYSFINNNCTHTSVSEIGSLWKIYTDCFFTKPIIKPISFI